MKCTHVLEVQTTAEGGKERNKNLTSHGGMENLQLLSCASCALSVNLCTLFCLQKKS